MRMSAGTNGGRDSRPDARIMLQPIAAPSVLGAFALASGLVIYGSWLGGGWGTPDAPKTFFPFVLLFSGIGQLGAALWAYSARDAVSASIHGAWAAFWLGWGTLWVFAVAGLVTVPAIGTPFASLGMWFIFMAVISWTTAFAALARNPGASLAQATLAAAATIAAPAMIAGSAGWEHAAGWVFVAAAGLLVYLGVATMLDNVFGIVVFPLLRRGHGNRLGELVVEPIQYEHGDPGVKVGQ